MPGKEWLCNKGEPLLSQIIFSNIACLLASYRSIGQNELKLKLETRTRTIQGWNPTSSYVHSYFCYCTGFIASRLLTSFRVFCIVWFVG